MSENEGPRSNPFSLGGEDHRFEGARIGSQLPTNLWVPDYTQFAQAQKCLRFLQMVGFDLDEWQAFCLQEMLGSLDDGTFAAPEVCLLVPRQNGKTAILEARELVGMFVLKEELIVHTAQLFPTARESYFRTKKRIEQCPELKKLVKSGAIKFRSGNDNMGIEFEGRRIIYMARGDDPCRGFTPDVAILDEGYSLTDEHLAAVSYATSSRANPQTIYASSTGKEDSAVLERIRDSGMAHEIGLALFEWCASEGADLDDIEEWYRANPALGIRIRVETVARERARQGDKQFGRERLGLWADKKFRTVIDLDIWDDRKDLKSEICSRYVLAIDATPSPPHDSAIALAGFNAQGKKQVEIVRTGRTLSWIVEAVERLYQAKRNPPPLGVVLQGGTAAGRLIPELQKIRDLDGNPIELTIFSPRDVADACGFFYHCVIEDGSLVHLDDTSVKTALAGATKIRVGKLDGPKGEEEYKAWYWGRKDTLIDISPLCALTYALWGLNQKTSEAELTKKHYEGKPFGGGVWLV